jgi:hypothetical protein
MKKAVMPRVTAMRYKKQIPRGGIKTRAIPLFSPRLRENLDIKNKSRVAGLRHMAGDLAGIARNNIKVARYKKQIPRGGIKTP